MKNSGFLPNFHKRAGFALLISLFFAVPQASTLSSASPVFTSRTVVRADPRPIARYVELLASPELAWSGRKDPAKGSEFAPDPVLPHSAARRRAEIEEMLKAYAPRIWLHPKEPYQPMDPMEFIQGSSLYYRHGWSKKELIARKGEVKANELGLMNSSEYRRTPRFLFFWEKGHSVLPSSMFPIMRPYHSGYLLNGEGYVLKYEENLLRRLVRRLGGAKKPHESIAKVPIFWRLGKLPSFAQTTQSRFPDRELVVIEYWYHLPYSFANRFGIGNHQGDWEGMAMLVELRLDPEQRLKHRLVAGYFASHEGGTWECGSSLSWSESDSDEPMRALASTQELPARSLHPTVYTARGTHATYTAPGSYETRFITDRTGRGESWDTWNLVRPLELEPYYGYTGAWGDVNLFSFMSGPLVPGPGYKTLPKHDQSADPRLLSRIRRQCVLSRFLANSR